MTVTTQSHSHRSLSRDSLSQESLTRFSLTDSHTAFNAAVIEATCNPFNCCSSHLGFSLYRDDNKLVAAPSLATQGIGKRLC